MWISTKLLWLVEWARLSVVQGRTTDNRVTDGCGSLIWFSPTEEHFIAQIAVNVKVNAGYNLQIESHICRPVREPMLTQSFIERTYSTHESTTTRSWSNQIMWPALRKYVFLPPPRCVFGLQPLLSRWFMSKLYSCEWGLHQNIVTLSSCFLPLVLPGVISSLAKQHTVTQLSTWWFKPVIYQTRPQTFHCFTVHFWSSCAHCRYLLCSKNFCALLWNLNWQASLHFLCTSVSLGAHIPAAGLQECLPFISFGTKHYTGNTSWDLLLWRCSDPYIYSFFPATHQLPEVTVHSLSNVPCPFTSIR